MASKEYFKLTPAVYLLLIADNKILLLRRFNTGYEDGNYSLVSGHMESGETPTQAIEREVSEEAGIVIAHKNLKLVHVLHRSFKDISNDRIDFFFTCNDWKGTITNMEPAKCDDLSWHTLNKLPTNTIGYIKQAIDCYKKAEFYSEYSC
jgi:8-oxo-dGTP diphosphatase